MTLQRAYFNLYYLQQCMRIFISPLLQCNQTIFYMLTDLRDGGGGERERDRDRQTLMWERNIDQLPLIHGPSRDQTHNPSMCPDQEKNPHPLSIWDDPPTNWATQPGLKLFRGPIVMGWIVFPLKSVFWSPNPQHLKMWLDLEIQFLKRWLN